MPATYYIKLTNAGLSALANAQATGTPVLISHFAVGDSNGAYYDPSESQTALVHEVWRDNVNRVYIHPNNPNWAVVEALIPYSDGGFDIREAGAFSSNGTLLAVGKYPLTNKPAPDSGSSKDLYVRMIMQVSNASDVQITIDGSLVMATTEYVTETLDDHEQKPDPHPQYLTVAESGLLYQPLEPTLTALAALTGSADKLPYFNGSETAALATLTAFARTILDDADAAAARSTMGAAPIASPTFTGTPAVPTASGGTNTTQIASTAFVQAAITALINSSPGALDTLNELAAALGNDPNFATTVTNALALKAPIASPALTGNPTGPTPAQFDNDTSLATSQFVQRALGNNSSMDSFNVSTALSAVHAGRLIVTSGVGGIVMTLPSASAVITGCAIDFFNGAGTAITVARNSSDLIWTNTYGYSLENISVGTGETLRLVSNGSNGWIVSSGSASLKNAASFGSSLASSGYQKLPSGLIIQWGGGTTINADTTATITLPIQFPAVFAAVMGSMHGYTGANEEMSSPLVNKSGLSQITFRNTDIDTAINGYSWFAIGY